MLRPNCSCSAGAIWMACDECDLACSIAAVVRSRSAFSKLTRNLVEGVIAAHGVESIIHFAGSVVVPDSMRDPLAYYRNNTMTTRSLLNAAVKCGVNRFIFSSTAAVYGNPDQVPVPEYAPTRPLSPYGSSKLMTEIMLHDVASAHGMSYVALRYFNVAGADPQARIGLATVGATHLLKIAVEAATGQRAKIDVFGTDYPTPDGSCIRRAGRRRHHHDGDPGRGPRH